MGTWDVTPEYVSDSMGETVLVKDIVTAGAIVEGYINITPAASGSLTARDLHWVRQAVGWQAAWLPSQPGYEGRMSVSSYSQDGVNSNFGTDQGGMPREYAVALAPMAIRALRNLSWKAGRSLATQSRRPCGRGNFLSEADDARTGTWSAL